MFENLTVQQTIIITGFLFIVLMFTLFFIKSLLKDSSIDFNMDTGILSSIPSINLSSEKKKDCKEEKEHLKRNFRNDIQVIINEIIELNERKEYIELIEKYETQLNSAKDYIEKERSLIKKIFLDYFDKKTKKQGQEIGNLASHNDYIVFECVLDIIYFELYKVIRGIVHEEEYVNADPNSIAFNEYINNKIQVLINKEVNILNRKYICFYEVTRTELYKLYKENEDYVRNIFREMFYDMKQSNDLYCKEIRNINSKIKEYPNDYLKRGISSTLVE